MATIQMKPLQQYFHTALFVNYQCALTFVSFAEIPWEMNVNDSFEFNWLTIFCKTCNDNQNNGKNSYGIVEGAGEMGWRRMTFQTILNS